jgi:hypothetical protein
MAAPTMALLIIVILLVVVAADAELPRLEHPPSKEDRSLTLLAVGDWGRRGQFNQSLVAEQVRIRARSAGIVSSCSCSRPLSFFSPFPVLTTAFN